MARETLADLDHEGHFWRHLKKMHRLRRARRRQWLESALRAQGLASSPAGPEAELLGFGERDDARALVSGASGQVGLSVQALSDWRMQSRSEGGCW